MEDEQIEAVKNWPEPKSVQDIQVFIYFANFYRRFIQGFSKIAALLTSMLKTTESSKVLAPKTFRANGNEVIEVCGRANKMFKNLSSSESRKTISPEI